MKLRAVLFVATLVACNAQIEETAPSGGASTSRRPRPSPPAGEAEQASETYALRLVQRFGVPIADPVGVACDGDHAWIAAGIHNAPKHTLAYVDLASGAIEKQY